MRPETLPLFAGTKDAKLALLALLPRKAEYPRGARLLSAGGCGRRPRHRGAHRAGGTVCGILRLFGGTSHGQRGGYPPFSRALAERGAPAFGGGTAGHGKRFTAVCAQKSLSYPAHRALVAAHAGAKGALVSVFRTPRGGDKYLLRSVRSAGARRFSRLRPLRSFGRPFQAEKKGSHRLSQKLFPPALKGGHKRRNALRSA